MVIPTAWGAISRTSLDLKGKLKNNFCGLIIKKDLKDINLKEKRDAQKFAEAIKKRKFDMDEDK